MPGTCVAVAMEGRRPLLSEVQALVTHTSSERPRRTTSGVDSARVAMILAVLQQHAGIRLHSHDVFVSSVGGARLTEPSNDLAIALAITSAAMGKALGRNVVAIGELGLSGELRRVRDVGLRLAEAGRMGFRSAVIPAQASETAGNSRVLDGMRVVDVDNIARALTLLGMESPTTLAGQAPLDSPRGFPRTSRRRGPLAGRPLRGSRPAPRSVTASSASCEDAPAP